MYNHWTARSEQVITESSHPLKWKSVRSEPFFSIYKVQHFPRASWVNNHEILFFQRWNKRAKDWSFDLASTNCLLNTAAPAYTNAWLKRREAPQGPNCFMRQPHLWNYYSGYLSGLGFKGIRAEVERLCPFIRARQLGHVPWWPDTAKLFYVAVR